MEVTGQPASRRLLDDSFDACAKWDFDQSVLIFGRWITGKLSERTEVTDTSPRPPKGKRTKLVPKHTLAELLELGENDPRAEAEASVRTDPDAEPIDFSEYDYDDEGGAG